MGVANSFQLISICDATAMIDYDISVGANFVTHNDI